MTSAMYREAAQGGESAAAFLARNRDALQELGERLRRDRPQLVLTCARGSSDHAATFGKYLIETSLGIPVASTPPSVAAIYSRGLGGPQTLAIVTSQSGRSPDLLATVAEMKNAGTTVIALVNDEASPLAQSATVTLPLSAGSERSVAATKSFIATLVGFAAITAHWAGDRALGAALHALPGQLEDAFALDWSPLVTGLGDARSMYVVARGVGLGIAQEAALKLKETCGLHAEAFSSAEVRHGPMAIVRGGFPVLAFAGTDPAGRDVRALMTEWEDREARLFLADAERQRGELPALAAHPAVEPILQIQTFYRAAEALSRRRGFDPDAPPYLKKVTETR